MNIPSDMPRTSCDCKACTAGCKTMPGCLVPGDLERIREFVGDQTPEFLLNNFLVSDGAKVAKVVNGTTYVISVPSVVPAQKPDGRCVFLDDNDHCKIHPVSPFGCSRCDTHLPRAEGDRRVKWCITQQIEDHQTNGTYSQACQLLDAVGLRAAPLTERKAAMQKELDCV